LIIKQISAAKSSSVMNSVSVWLLSSFTCWCCAFIDLYLIGQGRVICDNDPIVS
jgi:hypothetical protein